MELWTTGEICAEVADNFRKARISVEQAINEEISKNSYSINLNSWDCIAILRPDNDFREITRYSLKKRDMDFRLKIEFDKFQSTNDIGREALIFEMLKRSLMLLKEKKGSGDGIDGLIADIRTVAAKHGWLSV